MFTFFSCKRLSPKVELTGYGNSFWVQPCNPRVQTVPHKMLPLPAGSTSRGSLHSVSDAISLHTVFDEWGGQSARGEAAGGHCCSLLRKAREITFEGCFVHK